MDKNNTKLIFACYFVAISSFVYVFSGIAQINVPLYYPVLREWHVEKLKDAISMGFYSKLAFALVVGFVTAFVSTLFARRNNLNLDRLIGFTKASAVIGVLFFIAEEGHKWMIEKMKYDLEKFFFNYEMLVFVIVLGIFCTALCLSAKERK